MSTTGNPSTPTRAARRDDLSAYALHGYAIVSDDAMIADATGLMPEALKNDADWAYFQAELDLAQLVMLGRRSHELAPNPLRRRRLVVSSSVASLEERADAWWWNPAAMSARAALETILPGGGRVAVPGGQGVFDLLIGQRAFARFHLARAVGVRLPGGRPVFSAIGAGATLESVLGHAGLLAGPTVTLDADAPVVLTLWQRRVTPRHAVKPQ